MKNKLTKHQLITLLTSDSARMAGLRTVKEEKRFLYENKFNLKYEAREARDAYEEDEEDKDEDTSEEFYAKMRYLEEIEDREREGKGLI